MNKPLIFWDMDDVLADFTGYVNQEFGTSYKVGDPMQRHEWEELRRNHQRMFRDLKTKYDTFCVLHTFHLEWDRFRILTALPYDDHNPWSYATMDKFNWCNENIPGIPMFVGPYAHQKFHHCSPSDLLIDDKESNCNDWIRAGGKAFLFKDNYKELELWLVKNI